MTSKNEVKFEVGSESTARKLIELAYLAGAAESRWFRPTPKVTYMDLAEKAAREYANGVLPSGD